MLPGPSTGSATTNSKPALECRFPAALPRGGIGGIAEIADCVSEHSSRWYASGHFAFVLKNARAVPFTPWRRALLLREAPDELTALLRAPSPVT
jgi:hypothetical protein